MTVTARTSLHPAAFELFKVWHSLLFAVPRIEVSFTSLKQFSRQTPWHLVDFHENRIPYAWFNQLYPEIRCSITNSLLNLHSVGIHHFTHIHLLDGKMTYKNNHPVLVISLHPIPGTSADVWALEQPSRPSSFHSKHGSSEVDILVDMKNWRRKRFPCHSHA